MTVPTCSATCPGRRGRVGDVGVLARRWVFGEVWARTELSRRDRSLAVIAILTSLGASAELAVHVPAGVGNGLSARRSRRPSPTSRCTPGCHGPQEAMRTARDALARGPVSAEGLVLTAPRRFELREFDVPDIGDDDGVLRVEACGLCGTDHEQYTGHIPSRHSVHPWPRGDRHHRAGRCLGQPSGGACRRDSESPSRCSSRAASCDACRAGVYRRCERNGLATMVGFVDADRPPGLWGGYATHLYLGPDAMLLPVPDALDPALATMFNPLGAGIRWAVDLPGTEAG